MHKQIVKSQIFDELPPYPVRSFTYRKEKIRAEEVQGDRVEHIVFARRDKVK
jgi:hypothetical protein